MTTFLGQAKRRLLAAALVLLLATPVQQAVAAPGWIGFAQEQQNAAPQEVTPQAPATSPQDSQATPLVPGDSQAQPLGAAQSAATGTQSNPPQQAPSQQNGSAAPLGTAAAPYEKPAGVAASRPAGAAIAPAKQRRVRSILIKLSLVVAAGVAVGTVAALSKGSPSQSH